MELMHAQSHLLEIQQMLGETPGGIKRRRNPKFNFSQQLPVGALILQ
jgi:hypothetical protein